MSSTLADSNIVLQKIGHVQLTPQQKAEGERARQHISVMISKAVEQSMAGKKVRAEDIKESKKAFEEFDRRLRVNECFKECCEKLQGDSKSET